MKERKFKRKEMKKERIYQPQKRKRLFKERKKEREKFLSHGKGKEIKQYLVKVVETKNVNRIFEDCSFLRTFFCFCFCFFYRIHQKVLHNNNTQ